jgi:hypothetical protein
MEFIDVMAILGYLLRLLGAVVFGVAAGWLVLQAIKPETFHWALAATATVGLFLTFALIGHWVGGGGTMGAFGLGAGAAIIIWPIAARNAEKDRPPATRRK